MLVVKPRRFSGIGDILNSLASWRLLALMSLQDVKQRYRGSVLGPLWIAGGLVAVSLGIASLYSGIFKQDFNTFLPFVVVGMTVWMFISACLNEGCSAFLNASGVMRNTSLPVFLHALRVIGRNTIVTAHNVVVVIIIFLVMRHPMGPVALLAIPGLLLNLLVMIGMTYLAAAASARYRDVAQIITYLVTVVMFLTPLFWNPDQVTGPRRMMLNANPFFHMIEIVREPLMGRVPSADNYTAVGLLVLGGALLTLVVHSAFHKKIIHWL
jgi:ABC-type polysaccharide/polyol phosphate export permease